MANGNEKPLTGKELADFLLGQAPKPKGASEEDWKRVGELAAQNEAERPERFMKWFRGMQKKKFDRDDAPAAPAAPAAPKYTTRSELNKARQGFAGELKGMYEKYKEEQTKGSDKDIRAAVLGQPGMKEKAAGLGLRGKDVSDFLARTYAETPEQKANLTQAGKIQKIRQSIAGKRETPQQRYEREKRGQDARWKEKWDKEDSIKNLRRSIATARKSAGTPTAQKTKGSNTPMVATQTDRGVSYKGSEQSGQSFMDLYKKKPTGTTGGGATPKINIQKPPGSGLAYLKDK